ncbi:MAG: ferrous iron transporter B [Gammaproteobacteria bacterium]
MNLIASSAGTVALVGNPNCGKTALFNRLTGSKQKVANYAGVTVERKEGRLQLPNGRTLKLLDLPGAYSFASASAEEAITRDVCLGKLPGETAPDLLVCVADATNLRLHLRFVLEVRALGRPMLVALNKMDDAARRGITIDRERLADELGVPVVETVAVKKGGVGSLVELLEQPLPAVSNKPALDRAGLHAEVAHLLAAAVSMPRRTSEIDDRLDGVLLHPVWGLLILAAVMFFMFQAVFAWAAPLMDAIDAGVGVVGEAVTGSMPDGILRSLLVDGVIAGVGGVIIFLPQILILFLFILALEESGYLPRAAFLLDRFLAGAGLTGRSFIPLLSSFACAVPGIMATRTIQDPRDRLATILVAPLMTCSARLPVYALLIAAFIPDDTVGGLFNLQGLVLFTLYAAGIASAMLVAWVFKYIRRGAGAQGLMLELPSYQVPNPYDIAIGLKDRALIFLRRVGTIIFPLTIILWFLASFPNPPPGAEGAAITHSYAGQIGRALETVFAPLGFNWQICIALVPGLAAREVFVGALATVYALSATDDTAADQLGTLISADWGLPVALALLAWYVFAPQCIATLAVIKRETNSWRTMTLAALYLTALAYIAAFITFRVATALTS